MGGTRGPAVTSREHHVFCVLSLSLSSIIVAQIDKAKPANRCGTTTLKNSLK